MKRFTSLLISFLILMSAFTAVPAFAEDTHRLTVRSAQHLFEDTSADFTAGSNFNLVINLKTDCPLDQGTIHVKSNPNKVKLSKNYTSPYNFPQSVPNVTDEGEFILTFSSVSTLIDTTSGETFITLKGKLLDSLDSDTELVVDYETLVGGRYLAGTETVDPDFAINYVNEHTVYHTGFWSDVTFAGKEVYYPNSHDITVDVSATDDPANPASWYAWTWNDNTDGKWVTPEGSSNALSFEKVKNNIKFVRMPAGESPNFDEAWNTSGDLTVDGDHAKITFTETYTELLLIECLDIIHEVLLVNTPANSCRWEEVPLVTLCKD